MSVASSGTGAPAILLLTVKDDIVDKVLGLELGADDYMTKPFDMREIIARVKALSRRSRTPEAPGSKPRTACDSDSRTYH